tara:strand:+ start:5881 stop:6222 length:342 start_codon:yes stop_codon:yes gene_type:complete
MDDISSWKELAKYLWGLLVPAGWWMWNKQDKRIDKVEATMYTQENAKERRESVDKSLEDRRQDVKDIYETINERGRVNEARHEKTNDMIRDLTRDMSQGFSDLKDILLKRDGR